VKEFEVKFIGVWGHSNLVSFVLPTFSSLLSRFGNSMETIPSAALSFHVMRLLGNENFPDVRPWMLKQIMDGVAACFGQAPASCMRKLLSGVERISEFGLAIIDHRIPFCTKY
jgi:hypothetical protein